MKFEIRKLNLETNSNEQIRKVSKTCFEYFRLLKLFRISKFGFRVFRLLLDNLRMLHQMHVVGFRLFEGIHRLAVGAPL